MKIEISNGINLASTGHYQMIVKAKGDSSMPNKYDYNSLVTINKGNEKKSILFKFFEEEEMSEYDIEFVVETETLFYRTSNEWGIVDLNNYKLVKQEITFQPGIIERVIVDDEIKVESYTLFGKLIDQKPIDPPSTRIDSEFELVYNSPIWGIQRLKIE